MVIHQDGFAPGVWDASEVSDGCFAGKHDLFGCIQNLVGQALDQLVAKEAEKVRVDGQRMGLEELVNTRFELMVKIEYAAG